MAIANGWPVTVPVARALYVALVTDTGGFRFSNTHPRTLRIAADLLENGIDPESIYLDVYAGGARGSAAPPRRPLQTLVVEPDVGLAWVTVLRAQSSATGLPPTTSTGSSSIPARSPGSSWRCCSGRCPREG